MKLRTPTAGKLWLSLLAGLICVVSLVVASKPEPQAALKQQWAVQVELVAVKRANIAPVERAVGRLLPARRTNLRFEVPGRVTERLIEPGTQVAKGQALVQLDDADSRDRLEEAEAQYQLEQEAIKRDRELLALAKRNTVLQRTEVERLEKLTAKALSSGSQLDTARKTLTQLEAEEARLRHAVRTASARLTLKRSQRDQAARQAERTTLRAPFAGTINRVDIDIGDYALLDQSAVELLDLEYLDLNVQVRGEAVDHLELGETLSVLIDNRQQIGRLQALQYDPDPSTHTHALRVRLPAREVRPGELAAVELPLKPLDNALIIPASAILIDEKKTFVFQYTDGILHRKAVVLGPRVGDLQVVYSGITEGQQIVARDVASLVDAQAVEALSEMG